MVGNGYSIYPSMIKNSKQIPPYQQKELSPCRRTLFCIVFRFLSMYSLPERTENCFVVDVHIVSYDIHPVLIWFVSGFLVRKAKQPRLKRQRDDLPKVFLYPWFSVPTGRRLITTSELVFCKMMKYAMISWKHSIYIIQHDRECSFYRVFAIWFFPCDCRIGGFQYRFWKQEITSRVSSS